MNNGMRLALAIALGIGSTAACSSKGDSAAKPSEPATTATPEPNAPAPQPAAEADATAPEKPASAARTWSFDDGAAGGLPTGFTAEHGEWKLTAVDKGNALAQIAASRGSEFNIALVTDTSYRDVDLTVRLQAQTGKIDQGGGLVWRARDAKNYYVARYNPLEDNFRVYYVKDGKRKQIGTADLKLDHGAWHRMRVTQTGDEIECFLDDKPYLKVSDTTFADPGRIGLWTKADAGTQFDDLSVAQTDE